ncbi:hypothetical protein EJM73_08700 [Clostridium botulinum]|uniref:hypothetical protein n=1 Tax=Clostridium botulinum TaxID=1491 RepID=UPI0013754514|nr:hypothetical protein [Clostridium botulinum]NCI19702.1 hypothetical protein [Clostridium botulinum]NCI35740.1 hypothetical protein [Clostridium botulinum]NCI71597.1 hypothetical protein [Clostridium botulinum]NDI38789.1 hypothetical protein [Clostridium botulinum]
MDKDKIFQLGDDIEVSLIDSRGDEIFKFGSKEHDKKMKNKRLNEGMALMEIINNTWDKAIAEIRDKNKKEEFKNNEININRVTTDSIAKGCDKVKAVIDNRKDLNKYDIVRIIRGEYKGLSDKEYEFLDYVKTMDKVLIQTDKFNRLYVSPEDIELVKRYKRKYLKTMYNEIDDKNENITVEIENNTLTVTLSDGMKFSKKIKEENLEEEIKRAYYKVKSGQYNMYGGDVATFY